MGGIFMCENKCCNTCYKNEFCSGSGWYCKSCSKDQNKCGMYKVNNTSKRYKLSSGKERK